VQFSTQKNAGASKPVSVQFSLEDHLIRKKQRVGFGKILYDKEQKHFPKKNVGSALEEMNKNSKEISKNSSGRRHWWSVCLN